MKYLNEFRDPKGIQALSIQIKNITHNNWKIMEVCGGQTHSIVKYQLEQILPASIQMVHGPGCPVCVTPQSVIDIAIHLALNEKVILASFGDMMRVPGTRSSLQQARAQGAKIEMVYSPIDAVSIAQKNPDQQVVFLAVGFETTTLPNAIAVLHAQQLGLNNFTLLTHQVRVPPAIEAIMGNKETQVQGFLAAGHVCTLTGSKEYQPLVEKYNIPIVITGFEPVDILLGIKKLVELLETGKNELAIEYSRSARPDGNPSAIEKILTVFEYSEQEWRGIGKIPESGFVFKSAYQRFNALNRWKIPDDVSAPIVNKCEASLILQGLKKPKECPYFGKECHPQNPLGAPMVSSEGACAAYFEYN